MFDLLLLPLAPGDPSWIQGDNIKGLLIFVASIAAAIVGLTMIMMSRKGNIRKIAEMGAGAILGFVVLAGALGTAFFAFGDKFINWLFG